MNALITNSEHPLPTVSNGGGSLHSADMADPPRQFDRIPVPCPDCGIPRLLTRKDAMYRPGRRCHGCAHDTAERQAYLDEIAVERLLAGMPVNSTRAERQAAVAALTARQVSARAIAERLHLTQRTVVRLRARERVST